MDSPPTDLQLQEFASQKLTKSSATLSGVANQYNSFFCIKDRWLSPSQRRENLLRSFHALGYSRELRKLRLDATTEAHDLTFKDWKSVFTHLHSCPVLETIEVYSTAMLCSAVCTQIGAFLACSDSLETLIIDLFLPIDDDKIHRVNKIDLSDTATKALSEGIVQSKRLKNLTFRRIGKDWADVLTKAFVGNRQNESLQCLQLEVDMGGLDEALPVLLSRSYQSLKEIHLTFDLWRLPRSDQVRAVGKSLCTLQNSSIRNRRIFLSYTCDEDKIHRKIRECIDELVIASNATPILEIQIDFQSPNLEYGDRERWLIKALNRYNQLRNLILDFRWGVFNAACLTSLFEGIKSNESLESLSLQAPYGLSDHPADCWPYFFDCLRHKTNIKKLSLDGCRTLSNESFRSMMGLLQVNIHLEEIFLKDTPWAEDGKAVLVREALKRNKKQAVYFSTLGKAKMRFEDAKTGRLFLCGNPLAGKTRLRMTILRTQGTRSWLDKSWNKFRSLERTAGVDVEMLKENDDMQVSIWDLAGQEIFRALQDLILPNISHSSVFVFVFSPMKDNQIEEKDGVEVAFRDELKSWLRFVASNCQITGSCRPHVLVVITHKDKMVNADPHCQWAQDIVNDLRKVFKDVLSLHGGEDLFFLDAQNVKEVQPLTDDILHVFAYLLKNKTPIAPCVCAKLTSELAKLDKGMITRPVWPVEDFYMFISEKLESFQAGSFRSNIGSGRKVLEAVTLYMHDSGSVFFLPKCGLVVVDINWLTHTFLGKLFSIGHNFQVEKASSYCSSDGFVGKPQLDSILSHLSRKCGKKGITVDSHVLEQLLVNLGLCYLASSDDGVARYFLPSVFGREGNSDQGAASQPLINWETAESSDWKHFGYRLACEEKNTTSLSSAVFHRFQIHLRKEMKLTYSEFTDKNYRCTHDLIRLDWDGYFIIVENDGLTGDHIDILVRHSKRKQREDAISFVKTNILEEFRTFCASSEGCRGVNLVVSIIRSECVKKPTPHKFREHQVVALEGLKARLLEEVDKRLQVGKLNPSPDDDETSCLLNYEHVWPTVPEAGLPKHPELATDLLERKDLEEILRSVQEKQTQNLRELLEVANELDEGKRRRVCRETENRSGQSSKQPQYRGMLEERSMAPEDEELTVLNAIIPHIHKEFDGLHDHLDEVHTALGQQIQSIGKEVAKVFSLQRDVQTTLLSIMSKVDDMIGYSDALEKARIPRRPFLTTKDVGIREKLCGVVQVGTAVRLHLMCESRLGPHIVQEQPGLSLLISDENKEWLRLISVNSLKATWYLMKAGVQILTGAAQVIPEFTERSYLAKGGLSLADMALDKLKSLETMPEKEGSGMTEEAWVFLKNSLPSDLNLATNFRLHLVKYQSGTVAASESYAWLCASCIETSRNILSRLV